MSRLSNPTCKHTTVCAKQIAVVDGANSKSDLTVFPPIINPLVSFPVSASLSDAAKTIVHFNNIECVSNDCIWNPVNGSFKIQSDGVYNIGYFLQVSLLVPPEITNVVYPDAYVGGMFVTDACGNIKFFFGFTTQSGTPPFNELFTGNVKFGVFIPLASNEEVKLCAGDSVNVVVGAIKTLDNGGPSAVTGQPVVAGSIRLPLFSTPNVLAKNTRFYISKV